MRPSARGPTLRRVPRRDGGGDLLETATASGEIRSEVSPQDLLSAVASLCLPVPNGGVDYSRRMVALLVDGLRYGARRPS